MIRQKIRIIRKKRKTKKELLIEFLKKPTGILTLTIIAVLIVIGIMSLIISSSINTMPDNIGTAKRVEYLQKKYYSLPDKYLKNIKSEFNDGFCVFGVYRDSILFSDFQGNGKIFSLNWNETQFHSSENSVEVILPKIKNNNRNIEIGKGSIVIRNNQDYGFNTVQGSNVIQKAEINYFGNYGNIVIVGIIEQ